MLVAFYKQYGVLSRFTGDGSRNRTLAEFGFPKGIYPIGRLDADSEGLLLLSDEKELTARLLEPGNRHPREYWAQVERIPSEEALEKLRRGVMLDGRSTLRCAAAILEPQPDVPPREPPIRFRKNVPDVWISIEIVEGKNRQVRRMTAAVGHPTLRLIRRRIGSFQFENGEPGEWRVLSAEDRELVVAGRRS